MKLKTNSEKHEAQITIDYNEIIILKNALNKWNEVSISYLPMMTINELLDKLITAKKTIERKAIPRH